MGDNDKFSLERLEYLAYRRSYEPAAEEIVKLLALLDNQHGGLSDLGQLPSGNLPGEQRDAHFASRIAAAIAGLFADPNFQLSEPGFRRLIPLQRWLTSIFGASPLANADHALYSFNERGYDSRGQITLNDRDLFKFCLLYSLDSNVPLQADVLWQKNKLLAVSLFLALLASRVVGTDEALAKKELLLEWLPPKLGELSLDDVPVVGILHDVWMHCSYALRSDKHRIKRSINGLIRRKLLALGLADIARQPPAQREKPVVLCILEWFTANHSIYRTHSVSMQALRESYRLVGVSLREASDDITRQVFDEVHVVPRNQDVFATVRQIRELAETLAPDLVYYPSAGMFLDTIFLLNLRLAPMQMVALGHPATTHSEFIDYVLVEEDYIGDPKRFSEKLVALPRESIPYRPPADCPKIKPVIRQKPEPVRIAVAASLMKINAAFLAALRSIAQGAKVPVEFHFFSGTAFGLSKVYLQNVIRRKLSDWAVVYPHLTYPSYLENINRCDMFLNPFPFGNTNGIVDTVRQGLPGVCLTGPEVHEHIDEGLFRRLGLPEWLITRSADEYIRAAIRLVDNAAEREKLSRRILKTDPDAILFEGNPALFREAVVWLHKNHQRLKEDPTQLLRPQFRTRAKSR